MTRVDFYILEGRSDARERFACRLVDKAYRLGHRIYVHTTGAGPTAQLDDLLWTFRQDSFVPHERATADQGEQESCPVLIGHDYEPDGDRQVLINLADDVPYFFSRFERVAEIVDDACKEPGRQRFGWYRERGYALSHHRIDAGRDLP